MAGLVPAIHVFTRRAKDVDCRHSHECPVELLSHDASAPGALACSAIDMNRGMNPHWLLM
jgi:hypothetical protein